MSGWHLFMSPPTFFDIKFVLNQWTHPQGDVDRDLAIQQWETICDAYQRMDNVTLQIIPPDEDVPETVFTGDSIFLYKNKGVTAHFRHEERAPEIPSRANWFRARGFEILSPPAGEFYECNGDSMIWNDKLLAGYGVRSSIGAHTFLAESLDIDVISLQMVPPFYHLDLGLCPINKDTLAYFPDAFTPESRAVIEGLTPNLIYLDYEEVMWFGSNAKILDDVAMLNGNKYPKLEQALKDIGLDVRKFDTSEFNKAGGGLKCITLEHYM
jgi:N-dimethylarginine dimethylaminohydrolase